MKKWTRWEDWVAIAVGVVVAVSAVLMPSVGSSVALMITLGVLLVISGVVNLAMPGMVAMEYVQGALGLLLIVSPWIGGYADPMTFGPAWMSWIGGAVVVIVAALAIRPSMRAHNDAITH
jgi:hypothetical protein